MPNENWREYPEIERIKFRDWVDRSLEARMDTGHQIYGDTFQGDPLEYLIEELLDALFYAYVKVRRQHGNG